MLPQEPVDGMQTSGRVDTRSNPMISNRINELLSLASNELIQRIIELEYPDHHHQQYVNTISSSTAIRRNTDVHRSSHLPPNSTDNDTPLQPNVNSVITRNNENHDGSSHAVHHMSEDISTSVETLASPDQHMNTTTTPQSVGTTHVSATASDANNTNTSNKARQKKKSGEKEFDCYSYRQRYITLHIAYVGTNYHGFALQNHMEYQHTPATKVTRSTQQSNSNDDTMNDIDYDATHLSTSRSTHGYGSFNSSSSNNNGMNRGLRTVESELFTALLQTRLLIDTRSSTCKYNRCGRTDKGVSAFNQVVALNVRSAFKRHEIIPSDVDMTGMVPIDEIVDHTNQSSNWSSIDDKEDQEKNRQQQLELRLRIESTGKSKTSHSKNELDYAYMLNKHLPPDIRILRWSPVPRSFHARFDCTSRTYRYLLYNDSLNTELLKSNSLPLIGSHDYRNFCRIDAENNIHFTRYMKRFDVDVDDDADTASKNHDDKQQRQSHFLQHNACDNLIRLEIEGNAFLWNQVRCMVSALLACSDEKNIGEHGERRDLIEWMLDPVTTTNTNRRNPDYGHNSNEDSSTRINANKCLRKPVYDMASELPLILWNCCYHNYDSSFNQLNEESIMNLEKCYSNFHQLWRQQYIRACVLRQYVDAISDILSRARNESKNNIAERLRGNQLSSYSERIGRRYIPFAKRKSTCTVEEHAQKLTGKSLLRRRQVEESSDRHRAKRIAMLQKLTNTDDNLINHLHTE